MSISSISSQERLEYLSLESFLAVLKLSLSPPPKNDYLLKTFYDFLDKGLRIRAVEKSVIGDTLTFDNEEIKATLKKIYDKSLNTDISLYQLFEQYSVITSDNNKIPMSGLILKRDDVHDLYRLKYGLSEFPWSCVESKISSAEDWNLVDIKKPIHIEDSYEELGASRLFKRIEQPMLIQLLSNDVALQAKMLKSLKLPCSLYEILDNVETDECKNLALDNAMRLYEKDEEKVLARMKAKNLRDNMSIDILLENSIADLFIKTGLNLPENADEIDINLYVWKEELLKPELERVNNANYQYEETREAKKKQIKERLSKIEEILKPIHKVQRQTKQKESITKTGTELSNTDMNITCGTKNIHKVVDRAFDIALKSTKTPKPKDVFKLIKEERTKQEPSPKIDTDNIIEAIQGNDIIWITTADNKASLGYKRFTELVNILNHLMTKNYPK